MSVPLGSLPITARRPVVVRCKCDMCKGVGEIVCPECGGSGGDQLKPGGSRRQAQLKEAIFTVARQRDELSEMMPHNAARYEQEADAIIKELLKELDKIQRDDE